MDLDYPFPFFKNFLCCVVPYDDIINVSHMLQDNYEMYLLFYSIIEQNSQTTAHFIFLNVYWFQCWFTYHSVSRNMIFFFCLCKHTFSSKTELRQFSLIWIEKNIQKIEIKINPFKVLTCTIVSNWKFCKLTWSHIAKMQSFRRSTIRAGQTLGDGYVTDKWYA